MSNETLDSVILSTSTERSHIPPSRHKYICCCFSEKWCFQHQGLSAPKEYGENECLLCPCLDCCAWCLEFKNKKNCLCRDNTYCFLCCFTFIFE